MADSKSILELYTNKLATRKENMETQSGEKGKYILAQTIHKEEIARHKREMKDAELMYTRWESQVNEYYRFNDTELEALKIHYSNAVAKEASEALEKMRLDNGILPRVTTFPPLS